MGRVGRRTSLGATETKGPLLLRALESPRLLRALETLLLLRALETLLLLCALTANLQRAKDMARDQKVRIPRAKVVGRDQKVVRITELDREAIDQISSSIPEVVGMEMGEKAGIQISSSMIEEEYPIDSSQIPTAVSLSHMHVVTEKHLIIVPTFLSLIVDIL